MSKHPKADLYIAEREKGLTYREIAEKYGVTYQTVHNSCAKAAPHLFKPFSEKQVVYPNLRKWLNENRVGRKEFIRRMGLVVGGHTVQNINDWFTGKCYPGKKSIDVILQITGLTYEELWKREE